MIRLVLAALICGCTGVPKTPPGSAASEDAAPAPLPTVAAASSDEDASAQPTEHHRHGGDHAGH